MGIITKKELRLILFNRIFLILSFLPLILTFILYYIKPSGSICPLINLTHLPCATCGLTRAYSELTHLHFFEAISNNISIIFFGFFHIFVITVQILPLKIKKYLYKLFNKRLEIINYIVLFIIIFIIGNGFLRIIDSIFHLNIYKNIVPDKTFLKMIRHFIK